MPGKGVIRISAAARWGVILLLFAAGCAPLDSPEQHGQAIAFSARPGLLQDDATTTKAGTIKLSSFEEGDFFSVFGRRTTLTAQYQVFDCVSVQLTNGLWNYNPPSFWHWDNSSDYYDFIGVYAPDAVPARMPARAAGAGNLAVGIQYNFQAGDNYDLMAAVSRRYGNSENLRAAVPLAFTHLTSAVKVVVEHSSHSSTITLDEVKFKNLAHSGEARATMDAVGTPLYSWVNIERSAIFTAIDTPGEALDADQSYSKGWDLMIPQDLTQDMTLEEDPTIQHKEEMPRLLITYTPEGGEQEVADILLKDVCRRDGTPITSWQMGVKYTYHVAVRINGGLIVEITTTDWDRVEAQTPGLLI